ncbi:MAG TPA: RES family NAD+ phosphorylase [Candidatus Limnocylindrales bacterium]|nr:RES family NAD+ phosphorylase [Candidatus Limnocylindrales bacterium]
MLRHRPAGSGRSVLDETYLGLATDNRWSEAGLRAYYFASDVGLVAAEHARHIAIDVLGDYAERLERAVFRVPISLDRVLRLTDPAVVVAMGAGPINTWILDLARTQAAASYLVSQVDRLQGLIVPSVAFLDQPERFNMVVYRDAIDPAVVFGTPVHERDITIVSSGS